MSETLGAELLELLGEDAFVSLVQTFGGRRLYVPHNAGADHEIVAAIGDRAAKALIARKAPDTIRVPLARELRARHYRGKGKSNGEIASLLGITETAVNKIFARMASPPAKGSQMSLFPE